MVFNLALEHMIRKVEIPDGCCVVMLNGLYKIIGYTDDFELLKEKKNVTIVERTRSLEREGSTLVS